MSAPVGFWLCIDCDPGVDGGEVAEADLCRHCAARLAHWRRLLAERYSVVDRPDPTPAERQHDARSALEYPS